MRCISGAAGVALAASVCILLVVGFSHSFAVSATASSPSLAVAPTSGPVGTKIIVSGQGFPPNANLAVDWVTANVSWVLSGNPTQVMGVNTTKGLDNLGDVQSDDAGSFSVALSIPVDNGGNHLIQIHSDNASTSLGSASFTLEPSFAISSISGPAGSPITVTANGLGDGAYSTSYHVLWDNKYLGYMTGVTTHGEANFTLYAVGEVGVHYIDIYQGYPGPAYLNAEQIPSPSNLESWYPPLIPFHANYTITSSQFTSTGTSTSSIVLPLFLLGLSIAALVSTPIMVFLGKKKGKGFSANAFGRIGIILIVAALLLAGTGVFLALNNSTAPSTSTTVNYVPQVSVVRPEISVLQNTVTSGPRINVTPNVATVGTIVNVTGAGFAANANVPLIWSTEHGSNIQGYQKVYQPLRNATTNANGSFSFTMKVPVDLEGIHFIASAANLTRNSNATLYIERNATITPNEGPVGSQIVIQLLGTGWDYNTNIVAIDYDNSYVGYACGFSSQGNITVILTASGSPGIHSIDIYPSIWLGPAPPGTIAEYRYPLLTPYDHPEKAPSFHFSFLITSDNQSNGVATSSIGSVPSLLLISFASLGVMGVVLLVSQAPWLPRAKLGFNRNKGKDY